MVPFCACGQGVLPLSQRKRRRRTVTYTRERWPFLQKKSNPSLTIDRVRLRRDKVILDSDDARKANPSSWWLSGSGSEINWKVVEIPKIMQLWQTHMHRCSSKETDFKRLCKPTSKSHGRGRSFIPAIHTACRRLNPHQADSQYVSGTSMYGAFTWCSPQKTCWENFP